MKQTPISINNINRISVIGSLNPDKTVQDRVRILDTGGVPRVESNRLQGSSENNNI